MKKTVSDCGMHLAMERRIHPREQPVSPLFCNLPEVGEDRPLGKQPGVGCLGHQVEKACFAQIVKALAQADLREKYVGLGSEPTTSTPQEFQTLIRESVSKFAQIAKGAGIKPE